MDNEWKLIMIVLIFLFISGWIVIELTEEDKSNQNEFEEACRVDGGKVVYMHKKSHDNLVYCIK